MTENRNPHKFPHRRDIVSIADLRIDGLPAKHEHGLPVGNGRMGSLVWIYRYGLIGFHQSKLRLQINRVDVFGFNSYSAVPRVHQDYCGGCGIIEISFGNEAFSQGGTRQHLKIYDGEMSAVAEDMSVRVLAWHERDVMALEFDDQRANPAPIDIDLQMLRPDKVQNGQHIAESKLDIKDDRLVLSQEFTEPSYTGNSRGDHYCATAVAIGVLGRRSDARRLSHSTARLTLEGKKGRFTVLIGSDAGMEKSGNTTSRAMAHLNAAETAGFDKLATRNSAWWHDFWEKSFIWIPGNPEFIKLWAYYLYLSGCTMGGNYPAKFNGQIWGTKGDTRSWGGRYWWWNQGCMHSAFFAANHVELNNPLFDMRTNAYDAFVKAADQDWDSSGIFIPETGTFNGPEELPGEIAGEIRKVFINGELPSEKLKSFKGNRNTHESRWSWADPTIPVGWVSHVMVVAAKTADLFWRRYEYTLDKAWLRDRAYPMIKGAAEFYRTYPNLKKEADGKYHIYNTSLYEHFWGSKDCIDDLALMRGVFAVAIKASELLGIDEELKAKWSDVNINLATYPTCNTPKALSALEHPDGLSTFAQGIGPTYKERGSFGPESPRLRPMEEFDLLTLESDAPDLWQTAMATFEAHPGFSAYHEGREGSETSRFPIYAARLGRTDSIEVFLPMWLKHWEGKWNAPNGLPEKEGKQAFSVQGYGIFADALQQSLCQSIAPSPGEKPVIRVFPAWPRQWDASFQLLCKGDFLVTSSIERGEITFVEIKSQLGGECTLRNPWENARATLVIDGREAGTMEGSLLEVATKKGQIATLTKL